MKRRVLYIALSAVFVTILGVLLWHYYYPYKQNPVFSDNDIGLTRRCQAVLNDYKSGKYGDEVFFLASENGWTGREDILIFEKDSEAYLIHDDKETKTQRLSEAEFVKFRLFITRNKIDYLKDAGISYFLHDGTMYQYMHCTKKGTATVFMYGLGAYTAYSVLERKFFNLLDAPERD